VIDHKDFRLFSRKMERAMREVLNKGKSVFLYLNRRGYAPLVKCGECDYVWECPNCGIPLTYHKDEDVLLCHHCGFEVKGFVLCPSCKGTKIKLLRAGTQRIEEEVKKEFPEVEVFRLDRDAVSTEKKLFQTLEKLYENKPKIIVGTQMGVHGHNFPEVHLVGILRAEEGMFLPYYKAGERTFQLLVQACGRAGRHGEKGKVLLQTAFPDHYVIKYAVNQDYEGFFERELELRKAHNFPPFSRLALIRVEGNKEEKVKEFIKKVYSHIEEVRPEEVEVLGPSPCPLKKLKGTFRWQLLLRSKNYKALSKVLKQVLSAFEKPPLKFIINLDPEEIL
jgi:primosomal protein N' (replication factor Y)